MYFYQSAFGHRESVRSSRWLVFGVALLLSASASMAFQRSPAGRPNVVLIMTDDAGYGDTGSYGAPDIRTPNIDSLARDGVKLTDFYANAMSCTPTRVGLISGRYQQRYGMEFVIPAPGLAGADRGLPPLRHSLPLLMKQNGYATALIGKWHLGYRPQFSPLAHGFEVFFGYKSAAIDYYTHQTVRPGEGAQFGEPQPDLWDGDKPATEDGYMTDLITRRSLDFINRNAARPFFIDVAYSAPHSPFQPPGGARGNGHGHAQPERADYVAMMERVDRGVGEILQTLRSLRLDRNTIVIFTNDNGGVWLSHNAPLFHRKFSAWEGGIRVPALLRWPGRIPAGTVSAQAGITMDLTASILAATGAAVPPDARLEGINLFPVLEKKAPPVERTLFWRTAGPPPVNMNQKAVRSGEWKLIVDGAPARTFLFNVKTDPGERQDWFARRPDLVQRLQRLLQEWERDIEGEAKERAARLPDQPQPELQNPRIAGRLQASRIRGGDVRHQAAEVGVVECVEELGAELQFQPLPQSKHAEQRGIEVVGARPGKEIAARIAECASGGKGEGRRIEVALDQVRARAVGIEEGIAHEVGALRSGAREGAIRAAHNVHRTAAVDGEDAVHLPAAQQPFGRARLWPR